MPIHRRLPKKGFSNVAFRDVVAVVNVAQLEARFAAGATVDRAALCAAKLINGRCDAVKVLGNGELAKQLTVRVDRVSAAARAKIENAGGSVGQPE
jgi:large subunit ribosomal protein L15